MEIEWGIWSQIAGPIIGVFIGVGLERLLEKRVRLVAYFSHVSAFQLRNAEDATTIHNHHVIGRNAGRATAHNVRIRHNVLPDFNINPSVEFTLNDLPHGGKEIVIPQMVPGEELTFSYLYFPPLVFSNIHSGIKSDEGLSKPINVILQRQFPQWFNGLAGILILVGFVTAIYFIYLIGRWVYSIPTS